MTPAHCFLQSFDATRRFSSTFSVTTIYLGHGVTTTRKRGHSLAGAAMTPAMPMSITSDETKAPHLHTFLQYMRNTDLLANYHDWEHVERGLQSVLRRLGRTSLYEAVNMAADAQRDSGERAFRLPLLADLRDQLPAWAASATAVT